MSRLLVIDTETGGIDPHTHSLLSLAAVVWDDGRLPASIEILVAEPVISVHPEAMRINRIDLAVHGEKALPPIEAVAALETFVRSEFRDEFARGERVVLAGHNVGFDVGFLKRLYRLAGADFGPTFSHRTLDTAGILRFLTLAGIRESTAADSTTAFAEMGISIEDMARHTALGDAGATALLLTRLIEIARAGARLSEPPDRPG